MGLLSRPMVQSVDLYLVPVQPGNDFVALVHDGLFVLRADLVLELLVLHSALHVEGQRFEGVLGCDLVSLGLVLSPELLCLLHHLLNVLLAQPAYGRMKYKALYFLCNIYLFILCSCPTFFQLLSYISF